MKQILLLLAASLFTFQSARADFKNGNELVDTWRQYARSNSGKPFNENDDGFYTGYVAGVCDAEARTLFRVPEGATIGQACDVVGLWLEKHPEEWNKPAKQLVVKALKEAFPIVNPSVKRK